MSAATGGAGTAGHTGVITSENRRIFESGGEISPEKFWNHLTSDEFTREPRFVHSLPDYYLSYINKFYNVKLSTIDPRTEGEQEIIGVVVGHYLNHELNEEGLIVETSSRRGNRTIFIPINSVKTVTIIRSRGGAHKSRRTRRRQRKSRRHH